MALTYLPKLPEGLHPFYIIYKFADKIGIASGDKPLTVYYEGNIGDCFSKDKIVTQSYYDKDKKEWINDWIKEQKRSDYYGSYILMPDRNNIIYTNFDIPQRTAQGENTIYAHKSVDALKITIDGGDIRNMQKGMIWNVGEAITIEPKEAPQVCTFSSSNPDVCTVDETGKIVAVGEGECIITITSKM
ncbi:Ig-like domain-containing protein [Clostridium perfringens]